MSFKKLQETKEKSRETLESVNNHEWDEKAQMRRVEKEVKATLKKKP